MTDSRANTPETIMKAKRLELRRVPKDNAKGYHYVVIYEGVEVSQKMAFIDAYMIHGDYLERIIRGE